MGKDANRAKKSSARYDVFISYGHDRIESARSLVGSLRRRLFRVFWDGDVRGGDNYSEVLADAIGSCDAFVLLLTSEVRDSFLQGDDCWVRDELASAIAQGKQVVVFKESHVEAFKNSDVDKLPEDIRAVCGVQYVEYNARHYPRASVAKLCKALGMLGRRLRRLAVIVAAFVAIAAIALAVAFNVGSAWTGAPPSETSAHEVPPAVSEPVIALTEVPSYGKNRPIHGRVFCENGDAFEAGAYRTAMFLQLQEGGTYYPKPSYTTPDVAIGEDGSFAIDFVTGGRDSEAEVLHLMLVPVDYTPGSYDDVRHQAKDYVRVDRKKDGDVAWDPVREVP